MTLTNIEQIQIEFRPALVEAGEAVIACFRERLLAIYLTGSVAAGDALPGVSDVDWFMFVAGEPTEDDLAWCRARATDIVARYPAVAALQLTPHSLARLEGDSFWRFAVRHTAVRLYGRDLPAELVARGIPVDAPGRAMALGRRPWTQRILANLGQGTVPTYLYKEPDDPRLAMRKLARYFVVVEGAYLLMGADGFTSFHARDVLPALAAAFPQWAILYAMTADVLRDPYAATFSLDAYRHEALAFFTWAVERLPEQAS